jgi:hypothetical protein
MTRYAINSTVTAAQRLEVLRLAAEGVSVRRIAAEVFGSSSLRGRVERILKTQGREAPDAVEAEPLDIEGLENLEVFRLFFNRRVAAVAASGGNVSASELRTLMDVERRLEDWETVKRLNALTRHPRSEQDD